MQNTLNNKKKISLIITIRPFLYVKCISVSFCNIKINLTLLHLHSSKHLKLDSRFSLILYALLQCLMQIIHKIAHKTKRQYKNTTESTWQKGCAVHTWIWMWRRQFSCSNLHPWVPHFKCTQNYLDKTIAVGDICNKPQTPWTYL